MKMRNYFYAVLVCALVALPFTSCDDDDEKEELFAPTEVVSGLSFNDTDMDPFKIGGALSWTLPASEANITSYVIYLAESATAKGTEKLGEVEKGKNSFDVPAGTENKAYLQVVAKNITGESEKIAAVAVKDNSGDPIVTEIAFEDVDEAEYLIAGKLTWKLPEPEGYITGYVIYTSDDNTAKGEKIGEVAAGTAEFDVPEGTEYKAFIQVITKTDAGESENIAGIAIEDYIVKPEPPATSVGLFILNGGSYEANNASVSFYNFETGEMKSDVYRTINGKGLGDSAEEALMYGSKTYITVTTSNRLVVLDRSGKELKSFSPLKDDKPVRPRGMVAKDGKIYISYFYSHEVAVLDTASLEIGKSVSVGRYPEKLAAANGKIYVSNSGGLDYPNYGNTISVIDPGTMTVEDEIEVIINPAGIIADSEGDLYVVSLGDYDPKDGIRNTLQRIDGQTGEVSVIGDATKITLANDKLYILYAQYGEPTLEFKIYDTLKEEIIETNFIKDGTTISSPNAIAVDPSTEKVYLTHYDYMSTSSLYIFDKDGKLEGKPLDTGGYDAKWMFVINE